MHQEVIPIATRRRQRTGVGGRLPRLLVVGGLIAVVQHLPVSAASATQAIGPLYVRLGVAPHLPRSARVVGPLASTALCTSNSC